MFRYFNLSIMAVTCISAVACSNSATQEEGVSAIQNSDQFRNARDSLALVAAEHSSTIENRSALRDMTTDELDFHDRSVDTLADMKWNLRLMATCRSSAGELFDTKNAMAAVQDLSMEVASHNVGMLSAVDSQTAKAAEIVFEGRQKLLLDELDAYRKDFERVANNYTCAF